jgi:UDP-N-acetylmuramate dehydrogenase
MSLIDRLPPVRGKYLPNESLAPFTWFRVGGPAQVLFLPADHLDFAAFLRATPDDIPVTILGVGSNVIVRDGGIEGVVVRLAGKEWGAVDIDAEHNLVVAGAGALDAAVARAAQKAGLGGLEFLVGVPGSIGGALTMNAGCYGVEVKDVLVSAWGYDRTGEMRVFENADMGFSYRHSDIEGVFWVQGVFQGAPSTPEAVAARMAEITAQREASQPIREKTGGSTFANPDPPGAPNQRKSWQLIDQAGMRGARRGGAQVSEKHCNFLINTGDATAADIEGLGEDVRAKVKDLTGVLLHWEIKRLGKA